MRLIVNADDLGSTAKASDQICRLAEAGIVTSTTLMANMPEAAAAARRASGIPGLGIGAHLNLTDGPCLSGRASLGGSELDVDTVERLLWGRIPLQDIRAEFEAQIGKLLDAGVRPGHVDAHRHVWVYPGVMLAAVAAARRYGIRAARNPVKLFFDAGRLEPHPNLVRRAWQRCLHSIQLAGGMRTPRALVVAPAWKEDGGFGRLLAFVESDPRGGTLELWCHPGQEDDEHAALERAAKAFPAERRRLLASFETMES